MELRENRKALHSPERKLNSIRLKTLEKAV